MVLELHQVTMSGDSHSPLLSTDSPICDPPHQRFVYFLFKYLFYLQLKSLECEGIRLSSYVIKTVMMWAMEEVEPSEWGDDGSDPMPDLILLLVTLATYLEAKIVPNYFIRDANLLQKVPEELLNALS